jgi:hypothetical protein
MSKFSPWLLGVVLGLSANAFLPSSPQPASIQQKVQTACTECHSSEILVQQRLSKAAWTKEVDKMIKWGAVVDPSDREAFVEYLSTNFPPDKPAEPVPRSAKAK